MKTNPAIYNSLLLKSMLALFLILSFNVSASSSKIPEPFRDSAEYSEFSISYDDYSKILDISVLSMGKSKRKKATKGKSAVGTRLKSNRKVFTALEGNRFFFKNFKDPENRAVLTKIRQSLEKVPDEVPMKLLTNSEQLAYWLNLYNITLLEQLVNIYPKKSLEDELYDDDGILEKKLLKVAGIDLSLNDIQYNILFEKFGRYPQVMYGLYQGIIGGPNLRKEAYTGRKVFSQLEANADEFINSNRGTFNGKKGIFRVSSLYERNKQLFPNFKEDLKTHLLDYLDGRFTYLLRSSKKIRANIADMTINDLTGGYREYGGSANTNNAAMLDSVSGVTGGKDPNTAGIQAASPAAIASSLQNKLDSYGRFPPDVVKTLKEMNRNPDIKKGTVIIKQEGEDN